MTPEQAWKKMSDAEALREEVRQEFPCPECDGVGEHLFGHHYSPCYECDGTGIRIPCEEDE